MSYFRYEDKQIYYEESGEGTPLVLLHGNTACGKMFDPVSRHAEQIGDFFHKPMDELKVPVLLTGSLEDDLFPKGHCKVVFDEICAKTSFAKVHIFDHGDHPAMLSNMDEFVKLC